MYPRLGVALLGLAATLIGLSVASVLLATVDPSKQPPDPSQWKCVPRGGARDPNTVLRPEGGVKIIELTNAGEFADRCQATEAWDDLVCDQPRGRYQPMCKAGATDKPKLTLLYVHGWKHSSDPGDGDRVAFTRFVGSLARRFAGRKNVLGIYVGWNAHAPLLPGPSENLSFWSKKATADRIAQAGVVTKIVSATGALSNSSRGRGDQFIAIGHSFGARLLFSAVGQSLVYEAERAHPGFSGGAYRVMKGPTDAVILLNPAFEASRYTSIDALRRDREETFAAQQPPLLISISTTGDLATQLAFPVGQWLDLRREERETTTLGNYAPYFTHSLAPSAGACGDAESRTITNAFEAEGLCLQRLDGSARNLKNNPFLVATTTPDVIRDHNDIWNPRFSAWLTAFVAALERKIDAASPTDRSSHD